jgi:phosphoglycerate-specific signal transduction histidine kinase
MVSLHRDVEAMDDLIQQEETNYKRIAQENKHKLEELQDSQNRLIEENEVLTQKLSHRKATSTDLKKQVSNADFEIEQLKLRLK